MGIRGAETSFGPSLGPDPSVWPANFSAEWSHGEACYAPYLESYIAGLFWPFYSLTWFEVTDRDKSVKCIPWMTKLDLFHLIWFLGKSPTRTFGRANISFQHGSTFHRAWSLGWSFHLVGLDKSIPQTSVLIQDRPSLRDLLIVTGCDFAPEETAISYALSLQFLWPFEFRDAYKKNICSSNYLFSEEFNNRYNNLESWSLRPGAPDLFGRNRKLNLLASMGQTSPPNLPLEVSFSSYINWWRLAIFGDVWWCLLEIWKDFDR